MFHYIYKITNKITKKIYVGKHSSKNLVNKYMGSGTALEISIKKHGIKNFTKEILLKLDSEDEAYEIESMLVDEVFIRRPDVYNRQLGGKGFKTGTITVTNDNGTTSRLPKNDPRILSGEYYSTQKNKVNIKCIVTKKISNVSTEVASKFILNGTHEYAINLKGKVWAKNKNGENFLVHSKDIRLGTELETCARKGFVLAYDINGNFIDAISIDDSRYNDTLFSLSKNKVLIFDKELNKKVWITKNDIRYAKYISGEISHGNCGISPTKFLECPHCNLVLDASNAKRWHFDYCKNNKNRINIIFKTVECNFCNYKNSPSIVYQHHNNYCEFNPNKLDKPKKNKYKTNSTTCNYCGKIGKQPKMMELHIQQCKLGSGL